MWLLFLDKFVLQCAMTQIHLYFSKCPWLLNKVSNFFCICLFVCFDKCNCGSYFQINLFRLLGQCALTQVPLFVCLFVCGLLFSDQFVSLVGSMRTDPGPFANPAICISMKFISSQLQICSTFQFLNLYKLVFKCTLLEIWTN